MLLIKKIFCLLLCFTLFGCINIIAHVDTGTEHKIYQATRYCTTHTIGAYWNDKFHSRDPILWSYTVLTFPFWLVDYPCEIVFDTLTFPYDAYYQLTH